MKDVIVTKAGGHDTLAIRERQTPEPGPGEVRIGCGAVGVNYADVIVRRGLYETAKKLGFPIRPGFECAGTVEALGEGVTTVAVGDDVVAVTLFGGYASHVVVPANQVFPRPERLSVAQAAAFPTVFMTAWYALCEHAHPRPGAKILVHSAAGGVGGALVQLGKVLGCEVTGVVGGSHKVDAVRDAGGDHVIDKSTQDLWAEAARIAPDGFDVILDANGVSTLKGSYDHLAKSGKLVIYGFASMFPKSGGTNWFKLALGWLRTPRFNPLELTMKNRSILAFNLSDLFTRADLLEIGMGELMGHLAAGRLEPPTVTTYALDDVAKAHADIESGRTVGKLVLLP